MVHVSDLHVRRGSRVCNRLARQLALQSFDLLLLTGDYMEKPGHEKHALDVLHRLLQPLRPRLGTFGVFGNHDSPDFREQAGNLPVRWLVNQAAVLPEHDVVMYGLDLKHDTHDMGGDSVEMLAAASAAGDRQGLFRLLLAHTPSAITVAADMGMDLMLSGHTHGGQCRLPTGHVLTNACDLPLRLSSGLLRHRNTLAAVSRGLGYSSVLPRLFCPPHVPVYTLRQRSLPGQLSEHIANVQPW